MRRGEVGDEDDVGGDVVKQSGKGNKIREDRMK